jgi:hypothetical protein
MTDDAEVPVFASMTDGQLAAYLAKLRRTHHDLRELAARYAELLREPLVTATTRERLLASQADMTTRARVLELALRSVEHEQRRRLQVGSSGGQSQACDWTDEGTEPGTDPGLRWRRTVSAEPKGDGRSEDV